jgi:voltage-gated potassium channel Kch
MPNLARANFIERKMSRFLSEPPSVRTAAGVIVAATAAVVVGAGVLMRVLDHSEYPSIWDGIWWALQTVTTVGYGDNPPAKASGRIIAAFVMFEGIAFVTIVVAAVTSIFVARASKERDIEEAADDEKKEARLEAQLHRIDERLERLEKMLRSGSV